MKSINYFLVHHDLYALNAILLFRNISSSVCVWKFYHHSTYDHNDKIVSPKRAKTEKRESNECQHNNKTKCIRIEMNICTYLRYQKGSIVLKIIIPCWLCVDLCCFCLSNEIDIINKYVAHVLSLEIDVLFASNWTINSKIVDNSLWKAFRGRMKYEILIHTDFALIQFIWDACNKKNKWRTQFKCSLTDFTQISVWFLQCLVTKFVCNVFCFKLMLFFTQRLVFSLMMKSRCYYHKSKKNPKTHKQITFTHAKCFMQVLDIYAFFIWFYHYDRIVRVCFTLLCVFFSLSKLNLNSIPYESMWSLVSVNFANY